MKRILIATPTYDGRLFAEYVRSVATMLRASLSATSPTMELVGPRIIEGTYLSQARNTYASMILADESLTHILFVDADMGFRPEAVQRLIDFDKPFSGHLYPYRKPDQELIFEASKRVANAQLAIDAGSRYVGEAALLQDVGTTGQASLRLDKGFCRTAHIGFGLTLIARAVFTQMRTQRPDLMVAADPSYQAAGLTEVFQCFEAEKSSSGAFVGEDISFCAKWRRDCGGEIWACIDERITHCGASSTTGSYKEKLSYQTWLARQEPGSR